MRRREFLATAGVALTSGALSRPLAAADQVPDAAANRKALTAAALCVAPHALAAEAGAAILRKGGNAFDAIVAAGFVEAVVAPASCGIGGYAATGIGFHAATNKVVAIDANAVAPRAATVDMFPVIQKPDSNDYRLTNNNHKHGPLSVAVPGVLGGLVTMLERWGTLDRHTVMAPAIEHARQGIVLTPALTRTMLKMQAEAAGVPISANAEIPKVLPQPELCEALQAIASEGAAIFYAGRIGQAIADHIRKLGGILTRDDLAAYRALVVEPVSVDVAGHKLLAPPPAAGSLTSLQMVALFDRLNQGEKRSLWNSPDAFEKLLEIAKVAWEDRLTKLGDPDAMATPPQTLLAASHLDDLEARVVQGLAQPGKGRLIAPDPLKGTVHLAAADKEGNVVAWTQTHGGGFGSGVMVPGTGIVLGHGMCRFEPRPGWVNSIAAGKRPLHNMSPLIALKNDRAVLAVGAAGGRTIVNNSAALTIGRLLYGQSAGEAVAAPRLQCESLEPAVIENAAGAECIAALQAKGHTVKSVPRDAGTAHLIARDGAAWAGAAETRIATATVVAGS